MKASYDASQIKVLSLREAIRRRPGMYVGDTQDGSGLHFLVWGVISNSLFQHRRHQCNNISIHFLKEGCVVIEDDGPGLPVDRHPQTEIRALEIILTRFGQFYNSEAMPMGAPLCVVNALSENLRVETFVKGGHWVQDYVRGQAVSKVKRKGDCYISGTRIRFKPDRQIFTGLEEFNYALVKQRCREFANLNPGLNFRLKDERQFVHCLVSQGLSDAMDDLCQKANRLTPNFYYQKKDAGESMEVMLCWVEHRDCRIQGFVNMDRIQYGPHFHHIKQQVLKVLQEQLHPEEDGKDDLQGFVCLMVATMLDAKWTNPSREVLQSTELNNLLGEDFRRQLKDFLTQQGDFLNKK